MLGVAWQSEARAGDESPGFWVSWRPGSHDREGKCYGSVKQSGKVAHGTEDGQQLGLRLPEAQGPSP